jgi:hypothetical protein
MTVYMPWRQQSDRLVRTPERALPLSVSTRPLACPRQTEFILSVPFSHRRWNTTDVQCAGRTCGIHQSVIATSNHSSVADERNTMFFAKFLPSWILSFCDALNRQLSWHNRTRCLATIKKSNTGLLLAVACVFLISLAGSYYDSLYAGRDAECPSHNIMHSTIYNQDYSTVLFRWNFP